MLGPIEEELEEIGSSGNFENYENFLLNYSDFVLHPNHYLLMTAARNLVQVFSKSLCWSRIVIRQFIKVRTMVDFEQESILPNFIFSRFPILAVNLECL